MILLENKLEMFNKIVYKTKEVECAKKIQEFKDRCNEEKENKKIELEDRKSVV